MYAEALKPITDTMRKFPGVWDLPDAAGADKIKRLTIEVRTALNLTLPDEYIKFLKECDGLEFDGYIIYGTDHFLENQADYEDIAKQHIIFATPAGFSSKNRMVLSGNWTSHLDKKCSNFYVPET